MSVLRHGLVPPTATGYNIERSLRFNSADSAYLNRTPGSAGNRKTWTWSGWVKRSALGASTHFFGAYSGSGSDTTLFTVSFNSSDQLDISAFTQNWRVTSQVFRDVGAWYHIVIAFDTTQATAGDRIKLYVNGTQVTAFGTSNNPTQNTDYVVNNTVAHYVGVNSFTGNSAYFNGYLADVHLIDGSALTPSSFGENDTDTGVWKPKAYTGSYGTNGFKLTFSDNSGTTATTLGKDTSGNGNNWTPNNFSVTAGAGNDSLVDTPTPYGTDTGVGGEVRGNYCTLNPLTTTAGTYTQGNLRFVGASSWRRSNATIPLTTGKWYWEVTLGSAPNPTRPGGAYNAFGFGLSTVFNSTNDPSAVTDAVVLADNGYYKNFSGSFTDGGTAFSNGDTLSIAVDLDANTYTFRRNNTQIATGTIGGTAGRELVPIIISYNASYGVMDCNFGQRPFAYTAPSGFKALCTTNLPTPTIGATSSTRADDYFNTALYTGNGTSQSINAGLQADLLWLCPRSNTGGIRSYDILNYGGPYTPGVSSGSFLRTITTDGLYSGTANGVTELTSTGFSVSGTGAATNASSATYVGWIWKANGAGSSNTAGTITSTVSANTTAGFSIVTYTGNNTSGATVGHGLGVKPAMIICKRLENIAAGQSYWQMYHTSLGATNVIWLNLTDAAYTSSSPWNNTEPTSTVFTLGSDPPGNPNGDDVVAYCFAPVAGYSAFGSYTGNGSTDGPFVYTGFRPAFILIKPSSYADNWNLMDNKRNTYNLSNTALFANLANGDTSGYGKDFLSNGFKLRDDGASTNGNNITYIYAAFAENPFKYSLAR